MKCECTKCHGTGTIEITCPDCPEEGDRDIPLKRAPLITIGARPAMGKTALLLNFVEGMTIYVPNPLNLKS